MLLATKRRRGFTLIELMMVVVIIGVLASSAQPMFSAAQDRARCAVMQSNIHLIEMALLEYASDENGCGPDVNVVASSGSPAASPGGGGEAYGAGKGGGGANGGGRQGQASAGHRHPARRTRGLPGC